MTAIPVRCSLPLFPNSDTKNMPLLRPLFEKIVWPIKIQDGDLFQDGRHFGIMYTDAHMHVSK